jgi:hypothetical protein
MFHARNETEIFFHLSVFQCKFRVSFRFVVNKIVNKMILSFVY